MLNALQRDDQQYLEIVNKYDNDRDRGEREIDYFTEAFGQLQNGMAQTNADLLGAVYEELAMTSDHFGQYFTPENVSKGIAEMAIAADELEPEDGPYTVADPASGTGRLLVHAARQIPDDVDAVFYGQDKDLACAKMTALNLCFFNMDGYAVQGDSLTMDYRRVWQTQGSALGGDIRELEDDEWDNPYNSEPDDVVETDEMEEVDLVPDPEEREEDEGEVVDFQELRETTLSDFSQGEKQ